MKMKKISRSAHATVPFFYQKNMSRRVMNRSARATSTRSSASLRIRRGLALALPMRVHVYTHVCAHVCPHVYVHAHACSHVDATAVDNVPAPDRLSMRVHVRTAVRIHSYTNGYAHACTHLHTHTCICGYACAYAQPM